MSEITLESLEMRLVQLTNKLNNFDEKLGKIWIQLQIMGAPQVPDPNYLLKLKQQIEQGKQHGQNRAEI